MVHKYDEYEPHQLFGAAVRIFVALELQLEREAISQAIALLRPDWLIRQFSPQELERVLLDCPPSVVLCTTVTSAIERSVSMWILLNSSGTAPSTISINGEKSERPSLDISEIIEVIDRSRR